MKIFLKEEKRIGCFFGNPQGSEYNIINKLALCLWIAGSLCSFALFYLYMESRTNRLAAVWLMTILGAHELGHLVALKAYEVAAYPPLFCPYLGAVILVRERFRNSSEAAWTGLMGPLLGIFATVICNGVAVAQNLQDLMAVSEWCYMFHLFNLIPLGCLDGGRVSERLGGGLWVTALISTGIVGFVLPPPQRYNQVSFIVLFFISAFKFCKYACDLKKMNKSFFIAASVRVPRNLLLAFLTAWSACVLGVINIRFHGKF